jgi:hypothetical protein
LALLELLGRDGEPPPKAMDEVRDAFETDLVAEGAPELPLEDGNAHPRLAGQLVDRDRAVEVGLDDGAEEAPLVGDDLQEEAGEPALDVGVEEGSRGSPGA